MNNPVIRIRCPGCGSAAAVTLAVGQQLSCETCGTHFLAPIMTAEDLDAVRSSNTDFEVIGSNGTQRMAIHLSCSQPVNVGDRFGSLILREFVPKP